MKPAWWNVFAREMRDLWIGGKALHLCLLYTILLGLYAFFLASNAEVNLLPRKEMILEVVKTAIATSLLLSMIIAADCITAERERGTLETILLTPVSRRQIVLGKYFAAMSPVPVALALTVPYLVVLAKGDPVLWPAVGWLLALGGVLVPALAAMGMLASLWCNTTKISMAVTFMLYLLMLLPAEIVRPGKVMTAGELKKALVFQSINPIDAITKFLGRTLVFERPLGDHWYLLTTPVLMGLIVLVLLFGVAGPRLSLEATTARKLRALWNRVVPARSRASQPPAVARGSAPQPAARQPQESFPVPTAPAPARPRSPAPTLGPSVAASPTWWLVFKRELRDLWIGGKALNFTIAYVVLLGGYAYWQAADSTVSLIPPKEMVFELWKVAMMSSVFMGLIIGADMLSGERERTTLEALLLTPTSRMQVVVGKFLAAASTWPVSLLATIPYTYALAQGDEVFGQAIKWGALVGTALAPAFVALGMVVSFWSSNNKTSMFVSLSVYLLFLLPTQLQGRAQGGIMGLFFQALNPLAGTRHFLAGILVNNRTPGEYGKYMTSSVVLLAAMFVVLFWYAGPALGLEAGRPAPWAKKRAAVVAALIAALLALGAPSAASALQAPQVPVVQHPIEITIDKSDTVFRAGTPLLFKTEIKNSASESSHPVIVAMNIINLDKHGEVVDPEDWSPQRTQYVEPLGPGQSTMLEWRINAILDGDFMVYMVAIPAPGSPDATSQPVASSGVHLTVTPFTKLNPGGVLPYAIGGPVLLVLVIFFVYRHRRRQIDAGGVA